MVEQVWSQWNYERYHEAIRNVNVPVLLIAGDLEANIGMEREVLYEDARRIKAGAESDSGRSMEIEVDVVVLEGFSHFFWWEEIDGVKGADQLLSAMDTFFGWDNVD